MKTLSEVLINYLRIAVIYTGFEKLESSYTLDEYEPFVLKQFKKGKDIRFVSRGSAQNNEKSLGIEVTCGGTIGTVDFGSWGTGDIEGTLQLSLDVSFCELKINGEEIYYFDVKNDVYRIDGVDENIESRTNLNF